MKTNIPGTGAHPGWHHISKETEWADEPHLFSMGRPLDAPDVMPAGCMVAKEMHSILAGTSYRMGCWNEPVQLATTRA
ncbi:hypothetical protein [Burkholderia cenocepacia]|uniref:hypothetical protein n=1 Tax=Burkholderia cenocepacia TaxID=95486 RepID=UPI001589120B|nr:hypothetical protein [Burkholderia cenocepacia]